MKTLSEHLNEALNSDKEVAPIVEEQEESIQSEDDFRKWAEAKFKATFEDDLDEDRMKETIDGFLDDNSDIVAEGDWGELVGKFNASFAN